jgi:hypothetical protein
MQTGLGWAWDGFGHLQRLGAKEKHRHGEADLWVEGGEEQLDELVGGGAARAPRRWHQHRAQVGVEELLLAVSGDREADKKEGDHRDHDVE